ncbi:hypothetical protein DL93DRAFT_2090497 [Clavulina sp. PMI_390]|nr:hypothetical protein DL93DRAFT_2090497 [Clavulina sp. PMI_390]
MSSDAPVAIFKKKTRPTNARQRNASPPSSSSLPAVTTTSASEVVAPTRKTVANPLIQGTKKRKLGATDDDFTADDAYEAERGVDVKWKASGNLQAAAQREREIMEGEEAEQILKKQRREQEDEERLEDGMYHGSSSYKNHIKREKEIPKAMRVGPQRSNNTIRTVTIVDYQPDVCKDYKETGYCGFGDTCKFLHDRGTYLQGWQLDKLAAEPKKDAEESDDSSDEEDIPWACYICRKPYTDPIVTKCEHYFCSACAIKRFTKTPKCAACGAPTAGIFNRADKVIAKMHAKKAEKDKAAAAAGSDGENEGGGVEINIPGEDSD